MRSFQFYRSLKFLKKKVNFLKCSSAARTRILLNLGLTDKWISVFWDFKNKKNLNPLERVTFYFS